eukprot:gene28867-35808_t
MVAEIPLFGLGTWKIAKDVASSVVYEAIVGGVRHIDCAADYGNEVEVGEGINKAIAEDILPSGSMILLALTQGLNWRLDQLVAFCTSRSVKLVGYSPLGSVSYVEIGGDGGLGAGVLSEVVITDIAAKHNRSAAQIALRWNVQRGVAVIPKSNQAAHNVENKSIFDFELSADEMSAIGALNRNRRFNDPGVYGAYMGQTLPIFV